MIGPVADLAGQVQDKLKVVTAMRSKLAVAQDPQTEHVLNKDCINARRVNHIIRLWQRKPHAKVHLMKGLAENSIGYSQAPRKKASCRQPLDLGLAGFGGGLIWVRPERQTGGASC